MSNIRFSRRQFVKVAALALAAISLPRLARSADGAFEFLWITDPHWGRATSWDAGQQVALLNHIASAHPSIAFAILSGDITDHSLASEFTDFEADWAASSLASLTRYCLPGNHEEGSGLDASGETADGPATYAEYDHATRLRRWSFIYQAFKLIGYTSFIRRAPDPLNGFADVSGTDLTHLQTELESKGSLTPVIFSHFSPTNTLGNNIKGAAQTTVLGLMATHKVPLTFHGHRHVDFSVANGTGTNATNAVVNGYCTAYSQPTTQGGYHHIRANNYVWTIDTYNKLTPWAAKTTGTYSGTRSKSVITGSGSTTIAQ